MIFDSGPMGLIPKWVRTPKPLTAKELGKLIDNLQIMREMWARKKNKLLSSIFSRSKPVIKLEYPEEN